MRMRVLSAMMLAGLLAGMTIPAAQADQPAEKFQPTLLLRMKGFDDLIGDLRLLVKEIGREKEAAQIEEALKSQTGPKGLQGVDTTKPIGLYGSLDAKLDQSNVVLLLPIADEKAFLAFLDTLGFKPEKDADGLYSFRPESVPFPILFHFAGGYLHGTVQFSDKVTLPAKGLPAAETVLAQGGKGMVSLTANLEQIPAQIRKIAVSAMALQLGQLKEEELPDATDKQKALRDAVVDEATVQLRSLIEDGKTVRISLDFDRSSRELALHLNLAGKPGSSLTKNLGSLATGKSASLGMIPSTSVLAGAMHLSFPERIRKALVPVVDELRAKAMEPLDANARDFLDPLLKTLEPTLRAGKLDLALAVGGPGKGGKFTLLMAAGVEKGLGIEKAIKDLLEKVPEAAGTVKVDAFQVGPVNVHLVENRSPDENAKALFGEDPIHLAIRDDALALSYGEEGESIIKAAAASRQASVQPMRAELWVSRLAQFMAREEKEAPKIAKKVFTRKGDDRVLLEVKSGESLEVELRIKTAVLAFASLMDQARKKDD